MMSELKTNTKYDIPNDRIIVIKVSSECVIEVTLANNMKSINDKCMIRGEFIHLTAWDGNQNKFYRQYYYNFPEQHFKSIALFHVAVRPIVGEKDMLECQFFYRGSKNKVTYKILQK